MNTKNNLNIHNIIIVLLIITSCIGYYLYFTNNSSDYRESIKKLQRENNILQKQRDSIRLNTKNLIDSLKILKASEDIYINKIDSFSYEINNFKLNTYETKKELDKLKEKLNESENVINTIKNDSSTKSDTELIKSLKNKLK